MKVSILVPTLGERDKELHRLFRSIEEQKYKDCEIIVASQANHDKVETIISDFPELQFKHVKLNKKGLSYARNEGLKVCGGDIVILSDDDCWYPFGAFDNIFEIFKDTDADILLTQIEDFDKKQLYKNYDKEEKVITRKLDLMSRSSIEITFRRDRIIGFFDERFGLGSDFVCGEEVDFLLNNFKGLKILYKPIVTVYHPRKSYKSSDKQIIAKGALYAKHFSLPICVAVLMRDLIVKKENNFNNFFKGYRAVKSS